MARKRASDYDVHPGVEMVRKWAAELPAKTGRSLDEWADLLRLKKIDKPAATAWLKAEYALGTVTAGQLAEYTFGQQTWDGDADTYLRNAVEYVDGMFAGPKAHLRPIAEAVIAFARSLGSDVKVCPCKTILPVYRRRVFAELKPATRTRLELSLALGEVPFDAGLVPNPRAKGNDRLRHQLHLAALADFGDEAKRWLTAAYDADAA